VASQRQNQQNRSWFFKVVRMGESLTKAGLGGLVREMEQGTVVKITIKTWEQNFLKMYTLKKYIASCKAL